MLCLLDSESSTYCKDLYYINLNLSSQCHILWYILYICSCVFVILFIWKLAKAEKLSSLSWLINLMPYKAEECRLWNWGLWTWVGTMSSQGYLGTLGNCCIWRRWSWVEQGSQCCPHESGNLQRLKTLELSSVSTVTKLPRDVGRLQHLEKLHLWGAQETEEAKTLFRLLKLEKFGTVTLSFVFGNYCSIVD
jgi:hypothetical protein